MVCWAVRWLCWGGRRRGVERWGRSWGFGCFFGRLGVTSRERRGLRWLESFRVFESRSSCSFRGSIFLLLGVDFRIRYTLFRVSRVLGSLIFIDSVSSRLREVRTLFWVYTFFRVIFRGGGVFFFFLLLVFTGNFSIFSCVNIFWVCFRCLAFFISWY